MEDLISFKALYESAQKCKKGVMWKDSVAHYMLNIVPETLKLQEEVKKGTYALRPLRPFSISNMGKQREVLGVRFRDRVVQRSINDNCLYPAIAKSLIYDNSACQKHRGTDFARQRLVCFLQKHYRHYGNDGYILQCDIKGYYPNMCHQLAEDIFQKAVPPDVFDFIKKTLDAQYPGEVGYIPGSQMIQIAGIAVLNGLDHFIKERLRIKYYLRYMDDFILLHHDATYLDFCKNQITEQLTKMHFELHPKKTHIAPVIEPFQFLGFVFHLSDTGKVWLTVSPKNVKIFRKKLRRLVGLLNKGLIPKERVDMAFESWVTHIRKASSYRLKQRMREYYRTLIEQDYIDK